VTSPAIHLGPLAKGLEHCGRLLGAHFPSDHSIPVELIATRRTHEHQLARLFHWLNRAGYAVNPPESSAPRAAAA
jgi:hypothetical protein